MLKILMGIICFILFIPQVWGASFSDVPENHVRYKAIETLKKLNIIQGYADGSFQPDKEVTRAEALKIILKGAKIDINEQDFVNNFSDVSSNSWYAPYVAKAYNLKIINGNPDGSFTPSKVINKAEFLKMVLQSFQKNISDYAKEDDVDDDIQVSDWFYPYLNYAKNLGIISPTINNKLLPDKILTRGDCAEILYKIIVLEHGGDVQEMLNMAESNLISFLIEFSSNQIDKAREYADSAVFYTNKALESQPDEGIVKAAHKIARGFQNLCLAYQAGQEKNYSQLKLLAEEAKTLAGDAYNDDHSTQPLGKKIKSLADVLLYQINQ